MPDLRGQLFFYIFSMTNTRVQTLPNLKTEAHGSGLLLNSGAIYFTWGIPIPCDYPGFPESGVFIRIKTTEVFRAYRSSCYLGKLIKLYIKQRIVHDVRKLYCTLGF
jgi:hypothetical protein